MACLANSNSFSQSTCAVIQKESRLRSYTRLRGGKGCADISPATEQVVRRFAGWALREAKSKSMRNESGIDSLLMFGRPFRLKVR